MGFFLVDKAIQEKDGVADDKTSIEDLNGFILWWENYETKLYTKQRKKIHVADGRKAAVEVSHVCEMIKKIASKR